MPGPGIPGLQIFTYKRNICISNHLPMASITLRRIAYVNRHCRPWGTRPTAS